MLQLKQNFEKVKNAEGAVNYQQFKILLKEVMDIDFESEEEFVDICSKIDQNHDNAITYEEIHEYFK